MLILHRYTIRILVSVYACILVVIVINAYDTSSLRTETSLIETL